MKLAKLILCTILILILCLSLASCNLGGFKVDKDGNIKIKDGDEEINIGESKWNKSKMYGLSAPKAKLDSSISTEDGTTYVYSELKESEAEKFIEQIVEAGFTYNTFQSDYNYTGTNKDGEIISFLYDADSESGTISAGKGEVPDEDDENNDVISDKEWDSDKMCGLPDPGVKVVSFISANGSVAYTLEPLEDYTEYLDIIKDNGFEEDASEMELNDMFIYAASNGDGYTVTFSSSADATVISIENTGN